MVDGNEVKRKPGAVTVLALLASFLFVGPPAQAAPDARAQLGSVEQGKRTAPLRTSIRSQNDDRDADSALLPPAPAIVTRSLCARPAAVPCSTGWSSAARPALFAYRARAPPAR